MNFGHRVADNEVGFSLFGIRFWGAAATAMLTLFVVAAGVASVPVEVIAQCETEEDNTKNGPSNCDCCKEASADAGQPAVDTKYPVVLADGIVTESVRDANLPSAGFSWSHHRTYNSRLESATQGDYLPGINGERWKVDRLSMFLKIHQNQVAVHLDAIRKRIFMLVGATYTPPGDYRATLVHTEPGSAITGTAAGGSNKTSIAENGKFADKDLVGCVVRLTSAGLNKDAYRVITSNDDNTISWADDEELPDEADGYSYAVLDCFKLTFTETNDTFDFAGKDEGHGEAEGNLLRRSDAYGNKLLFKYDSSVTNYGRFTEVTNCQGDTATYAYTHPNPNNGRISSITVERDGTPTLGVAYLYHDGNQSDPHEDCGTSGDLILVHSCKDLADATMVGDDDTSTATILYVEDSPYTADELIGYRVVMIDGACAGEICEVEDNDTGFITLESPGFSTAPSVGDSFFVVRGQIRSTHYRYYRTGGEDGSPHQLKAVFEQDAIAAIIADNSSIAQPADLLLKADDYQTGSSTSTAIEDFASRSFTYYVDASTDTSSVNTVYETSENLQTKYGGGSFDETGYVKSETVRTGCGGCGSGSGGVTMTYYYMDGNTSKPHLDYVARLTVEDTTDRDGNGVFRTVYGTNPDSVLLRKVIIDDPSAGTPKYWCTSLKVGTAGKLKNHMVERRMPSAHDGSVGDDADVAKFLDPTGDNGANDTVTQDNYDGLLYSYTYGVITGRLTGVRAKKGEFGTAYYLSATDYGDGTAATDNTPPRLPWKTYSYPLPKTYRADSSRICTKYTYTFHDAEKTQLETKTTWLPIVDTDENGPGGTGGTDNVLLKEYIDDTGKLRWTMDGQGSVTYYAYDTTTDRLAYQVVDVDTDEGQMPADVYNPSGSWTDWGEGASYTAPPTGFSSSAGLNLETKYEYDDLGRLTKAVDPNDVVTYTVHLINGDGNDETRIYPAWDDSTDKPLLPVQVTVTDPAARVTETYAVDPSGISFTEPPDGTEPLGQSAYVSWTRNTYNALGQLVEVDRYHDIPSSGTGALGTNYYATLYRYDAQGRRAYIIEHASGTSFGSAVEQVTKMVYDGLGRACEIHMGVSGTSNNASTCTDAQLDALLKKVSASFYDESTPGTHNTVGVGDGLVTSMDRYYDASDYGKNVRTIYHYNWRGQLRGIEPEEAPYTVQDLDWMGRVVAVAQYCDTESPYSGEPTWTGGASSVVEDIDYAATRAYDATDTSVKRGSLAKTLFDSQGRVYRSEAYAVNSSGTAGNHVDTDYYYDRDGRLVGRTSTAAGGMEMAYDGAGRRTETRVVTELESTEYTDGAFNYRDPQPDETLGSGSSGDDKVLEIQRTVYDKAGNPTEFYSMEAWHDDTDGLNLDDGSEEVTISTTFSWYDGAHRIVKQAAYGTNTTGWTYADPPTRPSDHSGVTRSDTVLVTTYAYAAGRLQTVTDPRGYDTRYTYDDLGRTVQVEEAQGQADERTTLYGHDGLGNTRQLVADTANDETAGDLDGGLWTTDANDQVTTYTFYDATRSPYQAFRLTEIEYPDKASADDTVQITYDLDGRPNKRELQKIGANNRTRIEYVYDDSFRRLTQQKVTDLGGMDGWLKAISTAYDSLGRVAYVTGHNYSLPGSPDTTDYGDAVNQVYYEYNDLGQLYKEYQEHEGKKDASTLYVQYNNNASTARLESVRYPNARLVHYTYGSTGSIADRLSRLDAIKDDSSGSPGSPGDTLASYGYNGVARLVLEDFEQPDVRLDYFDDYDGSPASGTYENLDRFGRVKQQLWRDYGGGAYLDRYGYAYDANSNRLYRENLVGTDKKDELYHYDVLNRLTAFERGNLDGQKAEIPTSGSNRVRGEAWTLDLLGNWPDYQVDANGDGDYEDDADLDQSRAHNPVNEIYHETSGSAITEGYGPQASWEDPVHDARGNMTSVAKPTDLDGESLVCVYDAWNRLVEVVDGETTVARYEYDGLGRRTVAKFDSQAHGEPDGVDQYRHLFYSAGWQVLETRLATSDNASPDTLDTESQYVWSPRYIDAPILRDRDADSDLETGDLGKSGSGLEERLYYLTDANMNVTALVEGDGTVAERYAYDPYGVVTTMDADWTPDTTPDYDNRVLWCGYWEDWATGLYHVRHRVYHAPLGRWMQRDPAGYVDGLSLYEYVSSAPLFGIDPMGLGLLEDMARNLLSSLLVNGRIPTSSTDLLYDRLYGDLERDGKVIIDKVIRKTCRGETPEVADFMRPGSELQAAAAMLGRDGWSGEDVKNLYIIGLMDWLGGTNLRNALEGDRARVTEGRDGEYKCCVEKLHDWWERGGELYTAGSKMFAAAATVLAAIDAVAPDPVVRHHQTPREVLKQLPEDVAKNPAVRGRRGLPNRRPVLESTHKRIHKGAGGGAVNELTKKKVQGLGREPTAGDVLRIRNEVNRELDIQYEDSP